MSEKSVWLTIAAELQELSDRLDADVNVELKDVWRLNEYRKKLLKLKEQALKNCLQD